MAWIASAVAATVVPTAALTAAEVRFYPEAELRAYRDGNVTGVGAQNVSDEVARVGINLVLTARRPPTSFDFSYAPYRESYNDRSDLDYTGHRVTASLSHEVSRRSSFSLSLAGERTDRPQVHADRPDRAASIVPRTTQDRLALDLSGRAATGRRSYVGWSAGGSLIRYDSSAGGVLEDTDAYEASMSWGFDLSETTDLGARVGGQRLEFDTRDDTSAATVGFFINRQFARNLSASLDVGVVRSRTSGDDATDPSLQASLRRSFAGGSVLAGGVRQSVSNASGISAATLDRGVFVAWRPPGVSPRVEANVTAYYWRREGLASAFELETLETSESLAWSPGRRHFALGAFHSYHDQNDVGGTAPALETSYHSGGVFFRWSFQSTLGARS